MSRDDLARRLRLVIITDRGLAKPKDLLDVVRAGVEAGAPCIQLRNKGEAPRELLAIGRELRSLTRDAGALLVVNDRLDVAMSLEADGIHVGPDDLPVSVVRSVVPPAFLVGRSADDPDVARRAVEDGADYIGCGTVYPTSTKSDAGVAIGLDGLRRVVEALEIPVVGIGGINLERAHEVAATGAAGIAVVGAVMSARAPEDAVRQLLAAFDTPPAP